jgi:hypothetical protein
MELPFRTLLEVEFVQELKGEVFKLLFFLNFII